MSGLRRVWHVLWGCLVFPVRQRRRRIGIQLLGDHLLAGVLSTIAVYAVLFAVLYGLIAPNIFFNEGWDIDATVGEKSRAAGYLIDAEQVVAASAGVAAVQADLTATLRGLIPQEAPDRRGRTVGPDGDSIGVDEPPVAATLPNVEFALIVAADGTILASTDQSWAQPGQPVGETGFAPLDSATGEVLAADGAAIPGMMGNPYALGYEDHVTVGAFPIVDADGRVVGAVVLQGAPFDLWNFISPRELLRETFVDEWRAVALFVFAGFVVFLPVAFWRARHVSRRVKALTVAADAWAAGDLNRRTTVRGEDEIGRLGQHFNGMSERLAAADRARRAFVANVSHDLRTPVAIMRGHLERLLQTPETGTSRAPGIPVAAMIGGNDGQNGAATPTAVADGTPGRVSVDPATLELLHRETVTLTRLIDDLFTLARVEETQLPLELGPINLAATAGEAVEGLRGLAWTQSKVTVQSLIRPDLPAVMADPTRIRQILNNLIYNALRHTPTGGLVIVDARETEGTSLVEVSVMDTGVGIPPEKLPSIFERFFQGNEGTRSTGEGSGLGLHIVKQLVEAQGGTITVESSLGQGTVFRFRLPRAVTKTRT